MRAAHENWGALISYEASEKIAGEMIYKLF